MVVAMMMLEKSREKGRNADYKQFGTIRQLRTTFSNIYGGSVEVRVENGVLKSRKGEVLHLHDDPMQSFFIERFVLGLQNRMPVESKRDSPLLGHVVAGMLKEMERELLREGLPAKRRRFLTMAGGYMAVTYSYSLRGNEGFWVDGDRLVEHIQLGKSKGEDIPHVIVALLGRFKAEGGDRMHVFTLANETSSGVRNRFWLEKVVRIFRRERKKNCPAFCDEAGFMLSAKDIEGVMHPILRKLQKTKEYSNDIPNKLEIEKTYRCYRSFRKGAENTALRNGVNEKTINFVHRWSMMEERRGALPGFNMLSHYADGVAQRPTMLKFTAMV